jgi:TRAP-type mannitol/chloroaromatic compound transport system permease large subunit
MLVTLMLVTLLVMILLGVPIALALAGSSLFFLVVGNLTGEVTTPAITVIHRMVNGVDSFPCSRCPASSWPANLMNSAGVTKQICDFAVAAVGWLKGGLGHVNVAGSVIFAGSRPALRRPHFVTAPAGGAAQDAAASTDPLQT